ncbi:MAG: helix-turn-helix domain-containing protein [Candidatus Paceibacterota bacterium]|jgi:transcriptional regulator with XRE-family HTH domain
MINKRLAELRKSLGISQEGFGKKISIVKSGISNMENGTRSINDRIIKLICQEFNVDENWLKTGEGDMFKSTSSFEEFFATNLKGLDESDRKIITEYIKLSPDHRKIFKEFIRKMTI